MLGCPPPPSVPLRQLQGSLPLCRPRLCPRAEVPGNVHEERGASGDKGQEPGSLGSTWPGESPSWGLEASLPDQSSQGQLFGSDDPLERRVGRQIRGPWLGNGFIPSCTPSSSRSWPLLWRVRGERGSVERQYQDWLVPETMEGPRHAIQNTEKLNNRTSSSD